MKRILLYPLCLILTGITQTTLAQEGKSKQDKNEEIIIRKHGDKNTKITVEINGDDILINGKPLSDFKDDDITVSKRKSFSGRNNLFFDAPHSRGGVQFWNDGEDENETTAFLGVTSEEEDDKGVKITDVSKGSAAEKAGLQEGDIITKIDSKKISDPEELIDAVTSYKPKDEVKVYYERKGKSNDVKVTLGERKESRMRSFSFNIPPTPPMPPMPPVGGKGFKNFNFDMDSNSDHPFMNFLNNGHKRLGVRIEDGDSESGAKITNVEAGSAAEKAGLKKDDIITTVDGNKVKNVDEARSQVMETDKNTYTIKAKRNGTEMNFEIKIPKKVNNADL